jgi:excisionase family DNA binding protein
MQTLEMPGYSVRIAAENYLLISRETLYAWIRAGKVRAVKTQSGYEIPYAELHRLMKERGL